MRCRAGKLQGKATERTTKTVKPFAIAKVRAAGGDGEALFVNVIAVKQRAKLSRFLG